jgi:hypothetical protein
MIRAIVCAVCFNIKIQFSNILYYLIKSSDFALNRTNRLDSLDAEAV